MDLFRSPELQFNESVSQNSSTRDRSAADVMTGMESPLSLSVDDRFQDASEDAGGRHDRFLHTLYLNPLAWGRQPAELAAEGQSFIRPEELLDFDATTAGFYTGSNIDLHQHVDNLSQTLAIEGTESTWMTINYDIQPTDVSNQHVSALQVEGPLGMSMWTGNGHFGLPEEPASRVQTLAFLAPAEHAELPAHVDLFEALEVQSAARPGTISGKTTVPTTGLLWKPLHAIGSAERGKESKTEEKYCCYECRLSKIKCDGHRGEVCPRCAKNQDDAVKRDRRVKRSLKNDDHLPHVFAAQIKNTQTLLANLLKQVQQISAGHSKRMIADPFYGNVVCGLDDIKSRFINFEYSSSAKVVFVERHTSMGTPLGDGAQSELAPVLDAGQMNAFAVDRCPQHLIDQLPVPERQLLRNAWLCSYWIDVLFNWDRHQIFTDQYTSLGIEDPFDIQALIIELMYSISYMVEKLMRSLLNSVLGSAEHKPGAKHDNWAIPYALLMVCCGIKSSKSHKWEAKGLHHLEEFVSSLRSTSEATLKLLLQHRWEGARRYCGLVNENQSLFDNLLESAKSTRGVISVSFEHQYEFVAGFNLPQRYASSFADVFRLKPVYDYNTMLLREKTPQKYGNAVCLSQKHLQMHVKEVGVDCTEHKSSSMTSDTIQGPKPKTTPKRKRAESSEGRRRVSKHPTPNVAAPVVQTPTDDLHRADHLENKGQLLVGLGAWADGQILQAELETEGLILSNPDSRAEFVTSSDENGIGWGFVDAAISDTIRQLDMLG